MPVKTGQSLAGQFIIEAATGELTNADALPTGTMIVAGASNAAAITISNMSTGVYSWAATAPALTAGQLVQVRIAATLGVSIGGVVWWDMADTKIVSDLVDPSVATIQSGLATSASQSTIIGHVDDLEGRLTSARAGYLDNLSAGAVATAASQSTIIGYVDDLETRLTATRAGYLDNLSGGAVATAASLTTVATNVSAILLDTGTDGVLLATGAVTAAVIAAGAVDADALAADAGTEIGTAVWVSGTRTLTQAAAGVIATVSGSAITATRGDTMIATFSSLGSITGYTKLWFAAKEFDTDTDAEAQLFIEAASGLTYLAGAAHTPTGDGSISVTTASAGDLTVTVAASCMATLDTFSGRYDLKYKSSASNSTTLTGGKFTVVPGQVLATS